MKKLYVYTDLDVCDPESGAYHRYGGLMVVTSGYPNDALPAGTGTPHSTIVDGERVTKYGLPEPDHVYVVPDDSPDLVLAFPDAGCC